MARYKYENAHEWLMEKAAGWPMHQLFQEFQTLVLNHVDGDTIQELYQREMDEDGYFVDLDSKPEDGETCAQCDHSATHYTDQATPMCDECEAENLAEHKKQEADRGTHR